MREKCSDWGEKSPERENQRSAQRSGSGGKLRNGVEGDDFFQAAALERVRARAFGDGPRNLYRCRVTRTTPELAPTTLSELPLQREDV
ncbi:hypothetical protein TNCV_4597041 [Trichonephila clavipes]|uniref:Uncharacterized protein n=1 Tax=Trichonephila clavipes TaxID=2585209 RepID=A0A8X6WH05_TRICX|nr:hypothetical protein TNCV_4597041 [Trichonephila clavipes]